MARAMKDSGIEWIGEIPEEWQIGRIGQLYTERREKVSDTEYQPLSVTMKGVLPQLSTAAKTDAHDDRKLVRVGDFAINSRSDRRGSCGISPYEGSVSLINTILMPRNEMHPVYYNWLFHSTMFSDEFYKWGHGIVNDLWTTNWQDMKRIAVPMPPLEEQSRIADYLNAECARIDAVIEQTRASIEEYKKLKQSVITQAVTKGIRPGRKMKDSGSKWIEEVPAEWEVIISRFVLDQIGDVDHYMPESVDAGIPYIMTGDLKKLLSEVDLDSCKKITREDYETLCKKIKLSIGDIIFARYATIGTVCYVDTEIACVVSYSCVTIKPMKDKLFGKYLYYYLQASTFLEDVSQYVNSNTQGNVGIEALYKVKIPIPSIQEQSEISDYLDNKVVELEILIKKKELLLSELNNYKKSLIFEYVTGKRTVT